MIPAAAEQGPWSGRRWGWTITAVLAAQIGLVLWLGERAPVRVRPPAPTVTLRLAGNPSEYWRSLSVPDPLAGEPRAAYVKALQEWLALTDPTLFALPRREGFSGQSWTNLPPRPEPALDWTEEPAWLQVSASGLGTLFDRASGTRPPAFVRLCAMAEPAMVLPDLPLRVLPPGQSSLRVEGDLARRRLLAPLDLPSWPCADLLTNTRVRVAVRPEGIPEFVTVLSNGSGLKEADEFALSQARAARFETIQGPGPGSGPAPNPLAQLTWGTLIFQWCTVPPAAAAIAPHPK